jgi:hypothetical protein
MRCASDCIADRVRFAVPEPQGDPNGVSFSDQFGFDDTDAAQRTDQRRVLHITAARRRVLSGARPRLEADRGGLRRPDVLRRDEQRLLHDAELTRRRNTTSSYPLE